MRGPAVELIVEMWGGSHLYGTATPQSDLDYKGVFLPAVRDILLQRVPATINEGPDKAHGQKNAPGAIDRDLFSLQRYLDLLAEGQTLALEMLFAPDSALIGAPHPLWREIQANRHRFLSRKVEAALRYCQRQAHRFGERGQRLNAARLALDWLNAAEALHGPGAALGTADPQAGLADTGPHIGFVDLDMPGGNRVRHLEVCGKKLSFQAGIRNARDVVERLLADYGRRSLDTAAAGGIDWKSMAHAVRIGRQTLELLTSGHITLPLPDAAEILSIRQGLVPVDRVEEMVEALMAQAEAAATASPLPDQPDMDYMETLVLRAHRARICDGA
ncbi:DNA polymerase beta superfamily protein [Niveispirillum sp. KHB5.9]|uniref:DNA polymerase beta superfamily protein n=1 Tax=Niveispirillum sp. KHB5.9 TaxID=3400269 RepID=UPI003A85F30F